MTRSIVPNVATDEQTQFKQNTAIQAAHRAWNEFYAGLLYASTTFSVTSTASVATITGLSIALMAGRAYSFRAPLHVSTDAAVGWKTAVAASSGLTATTIIWQTTAFQNASSTLPLVATDSTLGNAQSAVGGTSYHVVLDGFIDVASAGTLNIQFAQQAASSTAANVLKGSTLTVLQLS